MAHGGRIMAAASALLNTTASQLWALFVPIDSIASISGLFFQACCFQAFHIPLLQQTILAFDVAWPRLGLFLAALYAASVLCSYDTPRCVGVLFRERTALG